MGTKTTAIRGDKLVKVWGAHVLKGGLSIDRLQRLAAKLHEENGVLIYAAQGRPAAPGSQLGDLLVGRPARILRGGTAPQ
jgi:hypothetical protein